MPVKYAVDQEAALLEIVLYVCTIPVLHPMIRFLSRHGDGGENRGVVYGRHVVFYVDFRRCSAYHKKHN